MSQAKGFQFKQFLVNHDRCAMKVGTDSILLGSWAQVTGAKRILDIGTGSGLLALMMAQKTTEQARITAIEIDPDAVLQAKSNVANSPWPQKITVIDQSLQTFKPTSQFDLVITNPPFFRATHTSDDLAHKNYIAPQRRAARQDSQLSLSELMEKVGQLLTDEGMFYLVLPADRQQGEQVHCDQALTGHSVLAVAEQYQLYLKAMTTVYSQPDSRPKRQLITLSKTKCEVDFDSLLIKNVSQTYTKAYKTLCKDFYLSF